MSPTQTTARHLPQWLSRAANPFPGVPRTARRTLEHDLDADVLAHFSTIRSRRKLKRDPVFKARQTEVEGILTGFEWDLRDAPRGRRTEGRDAEHVRALAWNIERGKRFEPLAGRLREDAAMASADLVLLTEVDIGMGRSGNRNIARELADVMDMAYVYANHHLVLSPGDWNERAHGASNTLAMHGSALLSRYPVRRFTAVGLPEYVDKFHHLEKRLGCKRALLAEVELPDGPLTVVVTHLDPFAPPRHRAWQMRLIVGALNEFGAERVLLGGDLNTTTYNLANGPSLLFNIFDKMIRKGVEGIVAEYLDPGSSRERPLFEVIERSGLRLEGFNAPGTGTLFCDTREEELVNKALDYMPQKVFDWLQRKLEPWNGVIPLRLDWFAGHRVEPVHAAVIERPTWRDQTISDHSPILVDFALERRPEPDRELPRLATKRPRRSWLPRWRRFTVGRKAVPRRKRDDGQSSDGRNGSGDVDADKGGS